MAFRILEHEAKCRAEQIDAIAMFMFQFESLCRNRLEYDHGLAAMSLDPIYSKEWATWLLDVRHKIGIVDLADLIYVHSDFYRQNAERLNVPDSERPKRILFGEKEGRIALANRGKDPLYLFSALQRQLGYPAVPRPEKSSRKKRLSKSCSGSSAGLRFESTSRRRAA